MNELSISASVSVFVSGVTVELMSVVILLQYIAATLFFGMALMSLLIWSLSAGSRERIIFACICLAAGTASILEAHQYFSVSVPEFNLIFRWGNTFSTLAALGILRFIVETTNASVVRRRIANAITLVGLILLVVNHLEPYGVLYQSIDGLRPVLLPWGESTVLAVESPSRWEIPVIAFLLSVLLFLFDGCYRLWKRDHSGRAIALAVSTTLYALLFGVHSYLVDSGRINMIYLNTYGVLGIVITMYISMAVDVVLSLQLSQQVSENERRWSQLLAKAQILVMGVDAEGNISEVNRAFEKATGFRSAELEAHSYSELFSTSDRIRLQRSVEDVMQGLPAKELEVSIERHDGTHRIVVWSLIPLCDRNGLVTGFLMIGADVTELRQKDSEMESALSGERERIAGDLHDSVTQTLYSTNAIAETLPDIWEEHPQEARQKLQELGRLTRGALAELRTFLVQLRPTAIQNQRLSKLIELLAIAMESRCHIPIAVKFGGGVCDLPYSVRYSLYRIAQEALNNVVKHSRASHAEICLVCTEDHVEMTIEDDGLGYDQSVPNPGAMGLEIMQERAASINAQINIKSRPNHGTRIQVVWETEDDRGRKPNHPASGIAATRESTDSGRNRR